MESYYNRYVSIQGSDDSRAKVFPRTDVGFAAAKQHAAGIPDGIVRPCRIVGRRDDATETEDWLDVDYGNAPTFARTGN